MSTRSSGKPGGRVGDLAAVGQFPHSENVFCPVSSAVGTKVFVRVNQNINGWEDIPVETSTIVLAVAWVVPRLRPRQATGARRVAKDTPALFARFEWQNCWSLDQIGEKP